MQEILTIGLSHYLALAGILFVIGLMGVVMNRRNMIVNINLVAFSRFGDNLTGQAFAMFVLTVAAAETAVGLAILVVTFRHRASIAVNDVSQLRG